MVALTSIFNFKMKIALERHHVTKTQQKVSLWLHWSLRCQSSTLKTIDGPAYAFSHFSHVILLSNANSEIPREIIRNFGSIVFYVPENPQKHPETQNWLFPRELGSSECNLPMGDYYRYFWTRTAIRISDFGDRWEKLPRPVNSWMIYSGTRENVFLFHELTYNPKTLVPCWTTLMILI